MSEAPASAGRYFRRPMPSPPYTTAAIAYDRLARSGETPMLEVVRIGQALEREGHNLEARTLYESALRDGRATCPEEAARLVRVIARTYIQESDLDAARDCATAALAISDAVADEAGRGYVENMLAII